MSDQKAKRFTFDDDKTGAQMPDLNELLYAKKPKRSLASKPDKSIDPTVSLDISKIKLDDLTNQNPTPQVAQKSTKAVEIETLPPSPQNSGEIDAGALNEENLVVESGSRQTSESKTSSAPSSVTPPRFAPPGTGEVVMSAFQPNAQTVTPPSSAPMGLKSRVKKASVTSAGAPLKILDASQLNSQSAVSFAPGIKALFERGKTSCVLVFNRKGDSFVAEEIVGPGNRATTWRGMEIVKNEVQDLIGRLNKFGYSEFSTLGMSGAGNFERTGFRTAFGADRSEFLTLVKVGAGQEMDAIVVVFSAASVQAHIPFFHSALMTGASVKRAA